MPDKEKIERAAEIQKAIDEADKRKRADEEASGQLVDRLLSKLDDCVSKIDAMSKRMDAMEENNGKDRAGRKDDETEEEHKLCEEVGLDPGEARPVVADADVKRRHALADAQSRADACAVAWGERADPPLAGETVSAYRRRQLRRYQKYSPTYKAADLESIKDETVWNAVESQVFSDAAKAAASPDTVEPGRLRMITRRAPSGHIENTFIGSPHSWMDQFGGTRRFVTKIDPKAAQ